MNAHTAMKMWNEPLILLLCKFLHNMLTTTFKGGWPLHKWRVHNLSRYTMHAPPGGASFFPRVSLPCMPPPGGGCLIFLPCLTTTHAPPRGGDGTWCYGECRGKCECLIFFRVSPCMPPPHGGWHVVLRRVQRQVRVPHFFPCLTTTHAPPRGGDGNYCYGECRGKCECIFLVSPPCPPQNGGGACK